MPPTDAGADAGHVPATGTAPGAAPSSTGTHPGVRPSPAGGSVRADPAPAGGTPGTATGTTGGVVGVEPGTTGGVVGVESSAAGGVVGAESSAAGAVLGAAQSGTGAVLGADRRGTGTAPRPEPSTPGALFGDPSTTDTDTPREPGDADADSQDTLDLRLPDEFVALFSEMSGTDTPAADDLLDGIGDWGPIVTPAGAFHLVPVRVERDLPVISRWMNDPAVAEFWQLAGPQSVTEAHLRAQLDGDGRSAPCLGLLEGKPMSYWEIYRADLDPLARYYPARPHDTGIHLLIGGVADRGRGLGSTLLRAVADRVLDKRFACARVVAEPDLRNTPSVAAFLSAGFRFSAEVDLPTKRAALMVRDRSLRGLL